MSEWVNEWVDLVGFGGSASNLYMLLAMKSDYLRINSLIGLIKYQILYFLKKN